MIATNLTLVDAAVAAGFLATVAFWMMLVFHLLGDLFRSPTLGGFAKAAWTFFLFSLPMVGALIYLMARGRRMHERQVQVTHQHQRAFEDYIRLVAATKE